MARFHEPPGLNPGQFVFLDIESAGLSSSPLFLIGVMTWADDGFEVRQYLARDYAEEAAVIAFFLDACAGKRMVVTFNGKSFDMPFVRARAAATGVPFHLQIDHFDLLHESRRAWKHRLPDCRLQTLEHHICGRLREDDIPGADIPDAYHEFVRTADASRIVQIVEHNKLDLVTLADLMTRFPPLEQDGAGSGGRPGNRCRSGESSWRRRRD
jgi:uncharacterized protein YprB with RNaseH-like and TPR domain